MIWLVILIGVAGVMYALCFASGGPK